MTEFDSYFADAFDGLLCEFSETIIYHPRTGAERTMDAIVDRSPRVVWVEGSAVVPSLIIRVHNDAAIGISHDELDVGDEFTVAVKAKATPERRTHRTVENSDGQVTEIAVF